MKKFLNILGKVILIILIGTLVYVSYMKFIKKEKVIRIGDYAILIVLTESMEPTIHENEMILIQKCDNYDLDDIVTYSDLDEALITHRIVQIDEYSFIAKGDNNHISDKNASLKNIYGKVIFHSKILGIFILYYLKFVILIFVIVVLSTYILKKVMEANSYENKET